MTLYTIGFTQKSAEEFFTSIIKHEIEILIDIRLNNNTQLAGFTKGRDLPYFLEKICNCLYKHEVRFAPNKELLNDYRKGIASWDEYEVKYRKLYVQREMKNYFHENYKDYGKILLMCSEPTPEQCHRRLLAEYIEQDMDNVKIIHI